jgi:dTMP kinase
VVDADGTEDEVAARVRTAVLPLLARRTRMPVKPVAETP